MIWSTPICYKDHKIKHKPWKQSYLLNITFNIAKHVASIKIMGEIRNKAKTITHINQWTCIWKLGLHKKILCLLRIIKVWFSSNALYLLNLPSFSSGLNLFDLLKISSLSLPTLNLFDLQKIPMQTSVRSKAIFFLPKWIKKKLIVMNG